MLNEAAQARILGGTEMTTSDEESAAQSIRDAAAVGAVQPAKALILPWMPSSRRHLPPVCRGPETVAVSRLYPGMWRADPC